ncbi:putative E2 [Equus asinus papillomavirus 1]|uniref:Regulatory protein E2 n=1 Tax=Equus asinus papillomavirus 1 TaxID=1163703 RepID=W5ZT83_9PAPI|nr:putative E2 [Equus asinus papillomavirus 1]AHI45084.1 putative E2 [Equus asinus papillomavirus 1]
MTALQERLDSVQEQQLQIIETGTTKLDDLLVFWRSVRQENALLHFARQKGLSRIDLTPVPSLAASACKAKQAIEIELSLEGIKNSGWDDEPWTLQDGSWDRYAASPEGAFKKNPAVVEVIFDENPENAVWYTHWEVLYVTDGVKWHRTTGRVCANGLFYELGGEQTFYERFDLDAQKYSTGGTWTVTFQGETMTGSLVSSSTDGVDGEARPPSPMPASTACGERRDNLSTPAEPDSSSAVSSNFTSSGGRSRGRANRGCPYTRTEGPRVPKVVSAPCYRPRGVQAQLGSTPPLVSPADPLGRSSAGERPPGAAGHSGSVGNAVPPAAPPASPFLQGSRCPVILVTGSCNQVKCWRLRCRRHHRHRYHRVTSTWYITGDQGNDRAGPSTVMVMFTDDAQRADFMAKVSFPPGVSCTPLTLST